MNYHDWKARRDALDRDHKDASARDSATLRKVLDHDKIVMLQYTLPSGTRTTITGIDRDRLAITSADDRGFLTLGMLTLADLKVFVEIREAIEAWQRGDLADLPRPAYDFGPWVTP